MDSQSQFKIVDSSFRDEVTSGRAQSPINQALKDGKTVFVPQEWDSTEGKKIRNRINSSADYYGLKMKSGAIEIDGQTGILIWWEERGTDQ